MPIRPFPFYTHSLLSRTPTLTLTCIHPHMLTLTCTVIDLDFLGFNGVEPSFLGGFRDKVQTSSSSFLLPSSYLSLGCSHLHISPSLPPSLSLPLLQVKEFAPTMYDSIVTDPNMKKYIENPFQALEEAKDILRTFQGR